ncbi:MAG: AHH domain-containing protein [Oscillospiraceae bacterium]|nr:AHH domain-containing protein [Oscillospiraceae bacterium]
MYEYIRPKQTSDRKSGASHDITQRRTISFGDSYADRNTKMGFRPSPEKGGVIQREKCRRCNLTREQCQCWEFESGDNKQDGPFKLHLNKHLNRGKLRKNLKAPKHQGEAHHIIPGCIVDNRGLDEKAHARKNDFDDSWNGILLRGPNDDKESNLEQETNGVVLNILHRKGNLRNHPDYNGKVDTLIKNELDNNQINDLEDCKDIARYIRTKIISQSGDVDCLDNLDF